MKTPNSKVQYTYGILTITFKNRDLLWSFGTILRAARKEAGLTQAELAHRLNTEQPAIARAESGDISSIRWLDKAIKACGFKLNGTLTLEEL